MSMSYGGDSTDLVTPRKPAQSRVTQGLYPFHTQCGVGTVATQYQEKYTSGDINGRIGTEGGWYAMQQAWWGGVPLLQICGEIQC